MFQSSYKLKTSAKPNQSKADLCRMSSMDDLLAIPKVKQLMKIMQTLFRYDPAYYEQYAFPMIKRMLRYVECLPDSQNNFFADRCGYIEYALLRAEAALNLLGEYIEPRQEEQWTEIQRCWQYALFTAALLQSIGKLFLDYQVDGYNEQGQWLSTWNPLIDGLMPHAPYYAFTMDKCENKELRVRLNLLLAQSILPQAGLLWISSYPEVFEAWLALIQEDTQSVRVLGPILSMADAKVQAEAMEAWLEKQKGQRSRAFRTFDAPSAESIKDLTTLSGVQFVQWLSQQLAAGELAINDPMLKLNPSGLTVHEDLFKLFVKDFPTFKSWQAAQKGFASLGFHDTAVNTAEVLFSRFGRVLPGKLKFNPPGQGSATWVSAVEMMNYALRGVQGVAGKDLHQVMALDKLNAQGQWVATEPVRPTQQRGPHHRG